MSDTDSNRVNYAKDHRRKINYSPAYLKRIKKNLVRKTVITVWATASVVTIVVLVKKNRGLEKNLEMLVENYDLVSKNYLNLTDNYLTLLMKSIGKFETGLPVALHHEELS